MTECQRFESADRALAQRPHPREFELAQGATHVVLCHPQLYPPLFEALGKGLQFSGVAVGIVHGMVHTVVGCETRVRLHPVDRGVCIDGVVHMSLRHMWGYVNMSICVVRNTWQWHGCAHFAQHRFGCAEIVKLHLWPGGRWGVGGHVRSVSIYGVMLDQGWGVSLGNVRRGKGLSSRQKTVVESAEDITLQRKKNEEKSKIVQRKRNIKHPSIVPPRMRPLSGAPRTASVNKAR